MSVFSIFMLLQIRKQDIDMSNSVHVYPSSTHLNWLKQVHGSGQKCPSIKLSVKGLDVENYSFDLMSSGKITYNRQMSS